MNAIASINESAAESHLRKKAIGMERRDLSNHVLEDAPAQPDPFPLRPRRTSLDPDGRLSPDVGTPESALDTVTLLPTYPPA